MKCDCFFFGDWLQEGTTFTRPTPGLAYNLIINLTHQNSLSGLVTLLTLVRFGVIISSRRGSRLRDLRGKVRLARSQPPCFTRVIYRLLSATLHRLPKQLVPIAMMASTSCLVGRHLASL